MPGSRLVKGLDIPNHTPSGAAQSWLLYPMWTPGGSQAPCFSRSPRVWLCVSSNRPPLPSSRWSLEKLEASWCNPSYWTVARTVPRGAMFP